MENTDVNDARTISMSPQTN